MGCEIAHIDDFVGHGGKVGFERGGVPCQEALEYASDISNTNQERHSRY